ncbi:BlaI/MecI/CopY family transcriptional regulator, partial [Stenotrophomonas maltophilia]
QKGAVQREQSERGYLFSPVEAESKASVTALGHVVRTFFNGSTTHAASALLGMSGKLDENDLDELEAMIAAARAKKGA